MNPSEWSKDDIRQALAARLNLDLDASWEVVFMTVKDQAKRPTSEQMADWLERQMDLAGVVDTRVDEVILKLRCEQGPVRGLF